MNLNCTFKMHVRKMLLCLSFVFLLTPVGAFAQDEVYLGQCRQYFALASRLATGMTLVLTRSNGTQGSIRVRWSSSISHDLTGIGECLISKYFLFNCTGDYLLNGKPVNDPRKKFDIDLLVGPGSWYNFYTSTDKLEADKLYLFARMDNYRQSSHPETLICDDLALKNLSKIEVRDTFLISVSNAPTEKVSRTDMYRYGLLLFFSESV